MSEKKLPRDVFIDEVFEHACRDRNIYFISADLGAKALDRFRAELPQQFLHAGICEQNMMDVAAGLAQNGKKVFVYAMGPFVTIRCLEQIKVALASMHLPCCIIGNGVGYSYNDAGPTHYATEDVSCMRAMGGCEILTPSDTRSALLTAQVCCRQPALRYVRLDRAFLPDVYSADAQDFWRDGIVEIRKGQEVLVFTNGYMVQKVRHIADELEKEGISVGIADVFRTRPIDLQVLRKLVEGYPRLACVEEHFVSGGTGSALLEALADAGIWKPFLRLGIPDVYNFDNGGRDYILDQVGLGNGNLKEKLLAFVRSI